METQIFSVAQSTKEREECGTGEGLSRSTRHTEAEYTRTCVHTRVHTHVHTDTHTETHLHLPARPAERPNTRAHTPAHTRAHRHALKCTCIYSQASRETERCHQVRDTEAARACGTQQPPAHRSVGETQTLQHTHTRTHTHPAGSQEYPERSAHYTPGGGHRTMLLTLSVSEVAPHCEPRARS